MEQTYKLYTLGSRGSLPVFGAEYLEFGGQTTCYILRTGTHALVLDCGTGLYGAADALKNCTKIDVVLTHMHYDHVLGLLGWSVFPHKAEITLYSTFEKWYGEKTIEQFFRAPFWPVQPVFGKLKEAPPKGLPLELGDGLCVRFFPSNHPDDANLLCIRAGTTKICALFDYEHCEKIPTMVKNCDILIYDGMYSDEEYPNHAGWGHSTWQEGCRLAAAAQVKKLVITHHDAKRTDRELRRMEQQAKGLFAATSFARAGDIVEI